MKREWFYQEIGNIDDELILAANEVSKTKLKRPFIWRIAGAAACICLIGGGLLFGWQKDVIYINEISVPITAKVKVPDGENTKIISMDYQELLAYYGVEELPAVLGPELNREAQSFFVRYQDLNGSVLYDMNSLYYNNVDGNKTLSMILAKESTLPFSSHNGAKQSKIAGDSVLLASSGVGAHGVYWADFTWNGVTFRMVSETMSEREFVDAVKDVLGFLE